MPSVTSDKRRVAEIGDPCAQRRSQRQRPAGGAGAETTFTFCGLVAGDDQVDLFAALAGEPAGDGGPVDFPRAVLLERPPEVLPARLVRGDQQRAGGFDVQPVDDAAAQPAFADADDPRKSRGHGVEDRAGLALLQRMRR